MKEYNANSTDTKHFYLTSSEKKIGMLKYENWFSFNAEIVLTDGTIYKIRSKGFWGTTIEVKLGETLLLSFQMNWKGQIVIITNFNEVERDFILKPKGILNSSYVLQDRDGQELLVIQPDFKWTKFSYDFNILTNESFGKFDFKEMLLLTTVHCVNYYMSMASS